MLSLRVKEEVGQKGALKLKTEDLNLFAKEKRKGTGKESL